MKSQACRSRKKGIGPPTSGKTFLYNILAASCMYRGNVVLAVARDASLLLTRAGRGIQHSKYLLKLRKLQIVRLRKHLKKRKYSGRLNLSIGMRFRSGLSSLSMLQSSFQLQYFPKHHSMFLLMLQSFKFKQLKFWRTQNTHGNELLFWTNVNSKLEFMRDC